jgi:predicted dehydrogenase
MYRHHPQTWKAKELVDGGALGDLQLIKGSFTFTVKRQDDFRLVREMGGGSIWDVGCYPISYARMIVGEDPAEVFGWQVEGPGGCDVSFVGQMKFGNGVLAQFDSGFKSPLRSRIEIVGSFAVLEIPNPFKPGVQTEMVITRDGVKEIMQVQGQELYQGEVEDMCDAALEGKPPRISLADSRGNVAVILGLLGSAQGSGRQGKG